MENLILYAVNFFIAAIAFAIGHKLGEKVGYVEALQTLLVEWVNDRQGTIVNLDKMMKKKG